MLFRSSAAGRGGSRSRAQFSHRDDGGQDVLTDAATRDDEKSPPRGWRQGLGWGIIERYGDRPGHRFCCETSAYLRRDEVGRGYSLRIRDTLLERCRPYGFHHGVAKIFADNVRGIEYKLRLGDERVGMSREIGFQSGRGQGVVLLQRVLESPAS